MKRLKATGVRTVSVSEENLATLRAVVRRRREDPGAGPEAKAVPVAPPSLPPVISAKEVSRPLPPASSLPPPPVMALGAGDKRTRWAALRERVLGDEVCRAHVRPGKQVVFGVGDPDAKIFFCGEAPGAEEEQQGEPFVGPAGQLLNKMIQAMGLKREDVYIGNIMNWRPEMPTAFGNRPPTAEEMAYCLPFLRAQIEVVDPALIVALGATAARGLLGADNFKSLGEIR
ncbi:MAG TPA: uracil-DNA glycosylase, partial [Opitutaceae bacterium]|nr:uracil-DNA glycosylase [Opitutaceae bacterium]